MRRSSVFTDRFTDRESDEMTAHDFYRDTPRLDSVCRRCGVYSGCGCPHCSAMQGKSCEEVKAILKSHKLEGNICKYCGTHGDRITGTCNEMLMEAALD
jgi:hypothetical protein